MNNIVGNRKLLSRHQWKSMIDKLVVWRVNTISERNFIYILSILIGILTGIAAIFLKKLVHLVESGLTGMLPSNTYNIFYLAYPLIGMTFTLLFVRYVVGEDINHGVTKILFSISRKGGRLKQHNTWLSRV